MRSKTLRRIFKLQMLILFYYPEGTISIIDSLEGVMRLHTCVFVHLGTDIWVFRMRNGYMLHLNQHDLGRWNCLAQMDIYMSSVYACNAPTLVGVR